MEQEKRVNNVIVPMFYAWGKDPVELVEIPEDMPDVPKDCQITKIGNLGEGGLITVNKHTSEGYILKYNSKTDRSYWETQK